MNNEKATILIVDDETLLRQTLRLSLERSGFRVLEARDGVEAMDCARQSQVDAAFLDIIMPNRDGLQTLAELRREHLFPIIAMSGGGRLSSINYLEAARIHGAAATLRKPFRMSEAVLSLQSVMDGRKEAPPALSLVS